MLTEKHVTVKINVNLFKKVKMMAIHHEVQLKDMVNYYLEEGMKKDIEKLGIKDL